VQQLLEEETRQKLALSSRLRQADSERESLQNQLEDEEEAKRQLEKQIAFLNVQLVEVRKKAEEEGEAAIQLDELKKKAAKDVDTMQRLIEELQANLDKLDKSRKKLQVTTLKKKKKIYLNNLFNLLIFLFRLNLKTRPSN
jgi:myosin protein heavy chain